MRNKLSISTVFLLVFFWILFSYSAVSAEDVKIDFDNEEWNSWLRGLRAEALEVGISRTILEAALADIKPIKRVIELDRKQPEFTLSFQQYTKRVISHSRIKTGKLMLSKHGVILKKISEEFHVQPRFVIALWGIETDFGRISGGFKVVEALATLAFEGRRAKYFRKELINALRILEEGHTTPAKMNGSWAGAMGQPQFMPSSFLRYAIDYDGDGRRDIWNTEADVFASAANYLSHVGWDDSQTWGREVLLPTDFEYKESGKQTIRKIGEWQNYGVRKLDGEDLPKRQLNAKIIVADDKGKRAFMVYDNYRAILRWNRSNYFALSVGLLADAISKR